MTRSFLLRFQEPCSASISAVASHGTQTKTAVAQEGPDSDPWSKSLRAVPVNENNAGTMSGTRVRTEQSDTDFTSASRTLPMAMADGTKSITAVRMETTDEDYRRN